MKQLSDFTRDEYKKLLETGMMFEFYPLATGRYVDDCPNGYAREQGECAHMEIRHTHYEHKR